MKFKVIWSAFAEKQIDNIYNYYFECTNEKTATKIIVSILKAPNKLLENPQIGQVEDLLKDHDTEYRYILSRNHKIIYSIDQENHSIKIADVFDTRQHPYKIKREK